MKLLASPQQSTNQCMMSLMLISWLHICIFFSFFWALNQTWEWTVLIIMACNFVVGVGAVNFQLSKPQFQHSEKYEHVFSSLFTGFKPVVQNNTLANLRLNVWMSEIVKTHKHKRDVAVSKKEDWNTIYYERSSGLPVKLLNSFNLLDSWNSLS